MSLGTQQPGAQRRRGREAVPAMLSGASGSNIAGFGRGMASATTSKKMQEEATCSICLHLMVVPVVISCGHSYCQACLLSFMGPASSPLNQQGRETFFCPQCRAPFQRRSLYLSKQLGNIIAVLREQAQEQELFCQEHGERLHLFCEDEGQLICWRCERELRHKGHAISLVEDVVPAYREKLQEAVKKLRQLEEECASQKAKWNEKIEARRQKIQDDFQNLHSFLREEERAYLWRLESEKDHTLRRLKERVAKLGQQSQELERHILELEEQCQGFTQKVLEDVKGALSRSQGMQLETSNVLSLDVQTDCEVTELYFDLRRRLRSNQGPCEHGLPLSLLVWDFLHHLTGLPGSHEADMEQFAETLRGRVTTKEALQELVDVIYEQALSLPTFRCVGAHLCYYLFYHLTLSSQRGSFSDMFHQRFWTEFDPIDRDAKGDEAARKRFHGFVLFFGELCLLWKTEGENVQDLPPFLRRLLEALLSNPVDDNLVCAVKLLKVTGPQMEDAWKEQGETDMEEVMQMITKAALDTPCSEEQRPCPTAGSFISTEVQPTTWKAASPGDSLQQVRGIGGGPGTGEGPGGPPRERPYTR